MLSLNYYTFGIMLGYVSYTVKSAVSCLRRFGISQFGARISDY